MIPQARPAPRYCPNCLSSFPAGHEPPACPECGGALLPKGYCPVCEDYWPIPVGELCPKHDLPLDAVGPPGPLLDQAGKPLRWATVAHYSDSQAADAPRIRLEAEGIPTFVDDERMGSRSMYHVATGGVRLKVPETLVHDARVILSQTWSATAAQLGIDELDEDEYEYEDEYEKGDEEDRSPALEPHDGPSYDALTPSLISSLALFLLVGVPCLILAYMILKSWY